MLPNGLCGLGVGKASQTHLPWTSELDDFPAIFIELYLLFRPDRPLLAVSNGDQQKRTYGYRNWVPLGRCSVPSVDELSCVNLLMATAARKQRVNVL